MAHTAQSGSTAAVKIYAAGVFCMSTKKIIRCAAVAAIYAALCLALAPISFGAVQVRVAEALGMLVVFGPEYAIGVTVGCFLANLLGTGFPDILFGTAATAIACVFMYLLRNHRVKGLALAASLPPVIFNALIVGPEIAYYFSDSAFTLQLCILNGISVAVGEVISCCVLGVWLVHFIEKRPVLLKFFTGEATLAR